METKAILRFARISPRKIRLNADTVRGKSIQEAQNILSFAPQKGAAILKKLLDSALANAVENANQDVDSLYIKRIYADQGPTIKRWRPRALGRATRIRKRTSHVTLVLDSK